MKTITLAPGEELRVIAQADAQEPSPPVDPAPTPPMSRNEETPITRIDRVLVQGGTLDDGNSFPYHLFVDAGHLLRNPEAMDYRQRKVQEDWEIQFNEYGVPYAEDVEDFSFFQFSQVWRTTNLAGVTDLVGRWKFWVDGPGRLTFFNVHDQITVAENDDGSWYLDVSEQSGSALFQLRLWESTKDTKAIHIVHEDDMDAFNAGEITRPSWRKAMQGYDIWRPMNSSGATNMGPYPIRADHYPPMHYMSWTEQGGRAFVGEERETDLVNGTGSRYYGMPLEARFKAANEIDAIYQHNLPQYCLEYKDAVDPDVVAPAGERWAPSWAADLWAADSIPMETKLSIFNDNEFDHVDALGEMALKYKDAGKLTQDTVRVELDNEVWGKTLPYGIGYLYYERRAAQMAKRLGRPVRQGTKAHLFQAGYDVAMITAYLRRHYPEIEWRGIFAVHTYYVSQWSSDASPAPELPGGWNNFSLNSLVYGAEQFFEDVAANRLDASLFAPRPASFGDWFETQGAPYNGVLCKREDGETHIAGIDPERLEAMAANPANWQELRELIRDRFLVMPFERGEVTDEYGRYASSGGHIELCRVHCRALAEHSAAYGMQTFAYEGGSDLHLGSYWNEWPVRYQTNASDMLKEFYLDFVRSKEMGEMQEAMLSMMEEVGWNGIADYSPFGHAAQTPYGTRNHFNDYSPRFAVWVKRMLREKAGHHYEALGL